MANPTVAEVLGTLKDSFQSIDFRAIVVCLGDNEGWRNVFTVIRFSDKTPDGISAEHEKLKKVYELPDGILYTPLGIEHRIDPYRGMNIWLSTYTVAQFQDIVSRIHLGIINDRNRASRVFDADLNIDLMNEEMYLESQGFEDRNDWWPQYRWGYGTQISSFTGIPDGQGKKLELRRRDLDKQVRDLGFADFQGLVERITERTFLRNSANALEIFVPIFARIDSVNQSGDGIKVDGRFHTALGNLTVECSLYESIDRSKTPVHSLGKVIINPFDAGKAIQKFSNIFVLREPPEKGQVTVCLFKQDKTRIDLHQKSSDLRSGVLTFRSFTSFVPEEAIGKYIKCLISGTGVTTCQLYKKYIPKNKSKKNEELIEQVVMYLFGLCQLNPILLSNPQYDVIEGGQQAGSADILASDQEGRPVLISCTMAMPDARKRDMLLAAQAAIASRIGVDAEMIRTILITGKPFVSKSDTRLVELAAQDLEQLWIMIQKGNIPEARKKLMDS